MKMPKLKDLVKGNHLEKEEAADLRDQIQKDRDLKAAINEAINKFDEPITITVHQKTGNATWRNVFFWKQIYEQKDKQLMEYLTEELGE